MSAGDATPGLPLNVLQRLSELQEEHGWLADDTLGALSEAERIPRYALEAVASFHPRYRRTPPPRVTIALCRDAACSIRGAAALGACVRRRLASRTDVEVVEVSCLGRCDAAPAAAVNDAPVGNATDAALAGMATGRTPVPPVEPISTGRRYATDPYGPGEPRYAVLRRLAAAGAPAFDGVPAVLAAAGLQGMGGAGFPTGRKWDLVRKAAGADKYVVCNAAASEPGTFKDRVILAELPHLCLLYTSPSPRDRTRSRMPSSA